MTVSENFNRSFNVLIGRTEANKLFKVISDKAFDGSPKYNKAVNRLKDSEAISKVIILLTDGVNNSGMVPPLTAAEIAEKFGIRVYTIGVGTEGFAPYPFLQHRETRALRRK